MKIYQYGYSSLRNKSEEVKLSEINDELKSLLNEMLDVMHKANGIGLASNQIGIEKRFFVLNIDNVIKKVINPEILTFSEETATREEGCLSIPGIYKQVIRPAKIKVKYLDENANEVIEELDGLFARAFQHELDHLDGILFVDKLSPTSKNLIRKKLLDMKKHSKPKEY